MDGLQLLDAIQANSTVPIRAVLLTGNTSPDQIAIMQSPLERRYSNHYFDQIVIGNGASKTPDAVKYKAKDAGRMAG